MKFHSRKHLFITVLFCLCSLLFADMTEHTVQKGDTLYSISRKYGISLTVLQMVNNLDDNAVLKTGQILKIPRADSLYTVQKGDTFYGIARAHGISVDELLHMNSLNATDTLQTGRTLLVPDKAAVKKNIAESAPSEDSEEVLENMQEMQLTDPRSYVNKKVDSSLVWPVQAIDVIYITGKVSGVSLTAKKNEKVCIIKAGTVVYSGLYRGFGKVVFVQTSGGQIYVYTGLEELTVQKGDTVVFGDIVGTVGVDTMSGKPQMNLMVFQNGKPVDPATAPRG
jgi:LysM repeat protein